MENRVALQNRVGCVSAMHSDGPYFINLGCLMLEDFTGQGANDATINIY